MKDFPSVRVVGAAGKAATRERVSSVGTKAIVGAVAVAALVGIVSMADSAAERRTRHLQEMGMGGLSDAEVAARLGITVFELRARLAEMDDHDPHGGTAQGADAYWARAAQRR